MFKDFSSFFPCQKKDEFIRFNGVRLPKIKIDKKYYEEFGSSNKESNFTFFKKLCLRRMEEKGLSGIATYEERLEKELSLIEELGYADYFLIIWDLINWCAENDILTGVGRGSAAGSLAMYLIGVTGVDPIKHDLLFERFISRARSKKTVIDGITYFDGSLLCDIDTDFDYARRGEVIEYLRQKYPNRVSKIATLTTLQGKLALKEAAKICGKYEERDAVGISAMIGMRHGKIDKLSDSLGDDNMVDDDEDEEGSLNEAESTELSRWMAQPREPHRYLSNREIFKVARKLEGLPKNFGVHASGIAITFDDIHKSVPTQLDKDGEMVSGYDKKTMENICVKLDILGLKTLTILKETIDDAGVNMKDIDVEDPKIYEFLQKFDKPQGIFQLEGDGQGSATKVIKPENIEELSDLLAIARPGAMAFIGDYHKVKKGKPINGFDYEDLDKFLYPTKGIMIYQETTMAVLHKIFGFTLEEAEMARRAIGKKKKEDIEKLKPKLYEAGEKRGIPQDVVDKVYQVMEDSGNYSFNKSHSVAYSYLAATCIWLKIYYPAEFYKATLKMANANRRYDKIASIVKELPYYNLKLCPPDITSNTDDFTISNGESGQKTIHFGLSSIKGISDANLEKIKTLKGKNLNIDKICLFDVLLDAKINVSTVTSLIMSGTLDNVCSNRTRASLEFQTWKQLTDTERNYIRNNFKEYGGDVCDCVKYILENKLLRENNKTPIIRESRAETIRNKMADSFRIYNTNRKNEKLAEILFERKLLGFSYSGKVKDGVTSFVNLNDLIEFETLENKEEASFVGVMSEPEIRKTKKKDNMLTFNLVDTGFQVKCLFWGKKFDEWKERNPDVLLKDGQVFIVYGEKSNDVIFLSDLIPPKEKVIYELKDLDKA